MRGGEGAEGAGSEGGKQGARFSPDVRRRGDKDMKIRWFLMMVVFATGSARGAEWYADVETTRGTFTVQLDWPERAQAVEAFAGLAEGWGGWVDASTGRPGQGDYFTGTHLSWVQRDESNDVLLLGNRGRVFMRADGTTNVANGAGTCWQDGLEAGGTGQDLGLPARSVALLNANGPNTLDGQWAVLLKDASAYYGGRWAGFGTVVSNWGLVEALAGGETDANGVLLEPVEMTGVRFHGSEGQADNWPWQAAASRAPAVCLAEVALSTNGTGGMNLNCRWDGPGQLAVACCPDLLAKVRDDVRWLDFNEENGMAHLALPLDTNNFGNMHFFWGLAANYPELGTVALQGRMSQFMTEWQWGDGTTDTYLHVLDTSSATGMVYKAEGESWTEDATIVGAGFWREGPNSFCLVMRECSQSGVVLLTRDFFYRLSPADSSTGLGRFQMTVFAGLSGTVEVWGDYMLTGVGTSKGGRPGPRGLASKKEWLGGW